MVITQPIDGAEVDGGGVGEEVDTCATQVEGTTVLSIERGRNYDGKRSLPHLQPGSLQLHFLAGI